MEVWKPIDRFENLYEVSSLGRVKSLKFNREKILKPGVNSRGYLVVTLSIYKNPKSITVHRLVLEQFLPSIDKTLEINHKNGNKLDNRLENLEWVTSKENSRHAWDNGFCENTRDLARKMAQEQLIQANSIMVEWTHLNYGKIKCSTAQLVRAFPYDNLNASSLNRVRRGLSMVYKGWQIA